MDNFLIKLTNCYNEHIGKLNIGLFPDYNLLLDAINYSKTGIYNQELQEYYEYNLEETGYYVDNSIKSSDTTNIIKLEVPTDNTLLLGHLPIMKNASGELYVKMPILENL